LEHELLEVGAGQIDRAGVRIDALRDEFDDIVERLAKVMGVRDDPGDVGQQSLPIRNALRPPSVPSIPKLHGIKERKVPEKSAVLRRFRRRTTTTRS